MKKKITGIIALICIMSMLVAFAACDKGNTPDAGVPSGQVESGNLSSGNSGEVPGGNPSGNVSGANEIQHFRRVMTAVLNEFSSRLKVTATLTSAVAVEEETVSGNGNSFEKPTALKEIYDYMDAVEGKESVDDKTINEFAIRNFIAVRSYGELINQICETNQIYSTPIKINKKENILPSTVYAVVLSEGNHIIAYQYGYDDQVGELVYKWDIDYVSDNEFSAKMMTVSNGKPVYYVYGDTDGESLFASCNINDNSGAIQYKTADSENCYNSSDFDAVEQCFAKVQYEFDSIDFKYLRALKDAYQNTAEQQQYDGIADALCKEYGID